MLELFFFFAFKRAVIWFSLETEEKNLASGAGESWDEDFQGARVPSGTMRCRPVRSGVSTLRQWWLIAKISVDHIRRIK